MKIKKTFFAIFFLVILISIFFIVLYSVSVSACELSSNDVKIEYKGEVVQHTQDETYYVNEDVSLIICDVVMSDEETAKVEESIKELHETFPDDNIEYYIDDDTTLIKYNGEIFCQNEKIINGRVDIKANEKPEYEMAAYKVEKIKSYKFYRSIENEKRIEKVVDIKYVSPTFQFVFDKVKPEIKTIGEYDFTKMLDEGSVVTFQISDMTGIDSVKLYIDDKQRDIKNINCDKRIIEYEYDVDLPNTNNNTTVKIVAEDLCGNSNEYTFSYSMDNTPPAVFSEGVIDGIVYPDSVKFSIFATDNSEKCNLYYKCFYTDENGVRECVEESTTNIVNNEKIWKKYDKEGIYDIAYFSYDNNENCSEVYSYSFGIDANAPLVRFDNVENGKIYGGNVTVYAYLKELFYDGVSANICGTIKSKDDIKALSLPTFEVQSKSNKNIYTLSSDGCYSLKLNAKDKVGRTSEAACTFYIDKFAPSINVKVDEFDDEQLNAHNGIGVKSKVLSGKPKVIVSTSDQVTEYETYANLYRKEVGDGYKEINTSKVVSVGLSAEFSVDIPYEGEYMLKIMCKDMAGNMSEKSVYFTVDENPPVIGYISDFNQKYLKYFSLPKSLNKYIKDMTDVKYKAYLNSKEISSCDVKKDGKYLLQVIAVDEGGNQSEEMIAFIIDNTKPKIIVSGVGGDGNVTKDNTVKLTLLDKDDYFKSAEINGMPLSIKAEQKEIEVKASEYGNYDISVEASDYAGNVTTQVVKMNCAYSGNPFAITLDESDIKTLTKNDDEIRERFLLKNDTVKLLVILGIITATVVIFSVISLIDMRKHKG